MVAQKIEWSSIEGQEHPTLGPAYVNNNQVYTSGIIGQNYGTGDIPESLADQTHLAIQNVKKVLEVSGSSLDKVFKVTAFISHADYSKEMNEIYATYFPQRPARSCVIAAFMDARVKFELEVIATTD
ncbi:protein Hmf1p [[Candida] jaroonii]|uniref:Protein Hmf1p n=1 Tax=[Candida] jaroonii TaxID=467808 RepID=A0ACA9YAG9_9ASCO|nr:protein Hmf1p [[Candida] jaroonii]